MLNKKNNLKGFQQLKNNLRKVRFFNYTNKLNVLVILIMFSFLLFTPLN